MPEESCLTPGRRGGHTGCWGSLAGLLPSICCTQHYTLCPTHLCLALSTHTCVCAHTRTHTPTRFSLRQGLAGLQPCLSFAIRVAASTLMIHKDWCPEGGGGKAREGREKVPEEIRSVGATCPVLDFLARGWQWPLLEKKVGGRWAGAEGSHVPS